MDILKAAVDWAKAEVFSTIFFLFFGLMFLMATLGFWQLGKTELAKAFVIPTLVAGVLVLTIGFGLFFTNKSRATNFPLEYNKDTSAFVKAEIERAEKTMNEFQLVLFKIIPLIIVAAALMIIFVEKPTWRAIGITTIAMMVVLLLVDSNSYTRMEDYHQQLISTEKDSNK